MSDAGRVLKGRYRLEQTLGGGGTSEVWRAHDLSTQAPVAIKMMRQQFARTPATRRRFLREAEIVQHLDHPGIVKVLAADEEDEIPFLVLELIEGETLRQLIDRSRGIGPQLTRLIGLALAEILAHAHGRGVLHRDLKPENVFLVGPAQSVEDMLADPGLAGRVRLNDFGQARVTALASLTGASLAWGTPEYMAPEVFARGRIDPRSDLYSLGVTLFELATGRLPWSRRDALARLGPAGARVAGLPESGGGAWFDGVLARLVARAPANRPQSAREAWGDLAGPHDDFRDPIAICRACGADADRELPFCLACGEVGLRFAHTAEGSWRLLLNELPDDAAAMGKLLDLVAQVARPLARPLHFLTGNIDMHSKEEREHGIRLPAILFDHLDEATARSLEQLFKSQNLEAEASRGGRFSLARLMKGHWGTFCFGSVGIMFAWPLGVASSVWVLGASWAVGLMVLAARERWRLQDAASVFTLSGTATASPCADALLVQATATLQALPTPEARSLVAEVVAALYRLSRRLAQLRGEPAQNLDPRVNQALGSRLLAEAPVLLARVAALGERLASVDGFLAAGSEVELMQELSRIERRLAQSHDGAPDTDTAATLVESRHRLEERLDRRHQLEIERDQVTSALLDLLAQLREAIREVDRQLSGAAAPALEQTSALASLEATLATAPQARTGC